MAPGYIPDPIVENILTRLQAKPLLRFRCVSNHWNSLITDPHFMRSRSRRMIFVTTGTHILMIDANVTLDSTCQNSILKVPYPCENLKSDKPATILGTFNGLVLLQYPGIPKSPMILYNPFTHASKIIPYSVHSSDDRRGDAYGFGYGATTDDLRIIVLYNTHSFYNPTSYIACEVFNLKTSSWSTCTLQDPNIKQIKPKDPVGTFLNGYLYWIVLGGNKLIALNLKDMVLSEIHLPLERHFQAHLDTTHGHLCLIYIELYGFGIWVMNGQGVQNSWSCTYSRKLFLSCNPFYIPICTLDKGKILLLMKKIHHQLIIYDTSNDSHIVLNAMISPDDVHIIRGIEYVESLFSPTGACFA